MDFHRRLRVFLTPALAAALLATPAAAHASQQPPVARAVAIRVAERDSKVRFERSRHPDLRPSATVQGSNWQIDFYSGSRDLAQVVVDGATGLVRESWSGYQVAWKMARGYPGAFGHRLNSIFVWLPLCAIFLLGLTDWRRPWRLVHLDLVVLLAFSASQYFFNRGQIGLSVPLAYPPLLYLAGRMIWIGFSGRGEGLRPRWPARWLLVAALFLVGFRVGLNVLDSGVIDVGYSGVIGAHHVVEGQPIYTNFPSDNSTGDTYGPLAYYSYVPFERVYPWSGRWDDLPSAHAAAVFFDLATFAGLVLLGRRLREGAAGRRLGATLGFAWAAFPYTAYVLESNSNDALVSLVLVALLLALARPFLRGALSALAALTKFAPLILAPLFAGYRSPPASLAQPSAVRPGAGSRSALARFGLGFALAAAAVMAQTVIDPGLATFWHRTLASQIDRSSPFSVWGQVGGLEGLRWALIGLTAALAVFVFFRPRDKSVVQLSALGAALLICLELALRHWFYLYLVWFFPYLVVAIASMSPRPGQESAQSTPPAHPDERRQGLPSPRRSPRQSQSERASAF